MRPLLSSLGSYPRLADETEDAIRKAVELQRANGMGLLTDGEVRGDILHAYAELPGVRVQSGMPRIVGKIQPVDDPSAFSKIRDLAFLQSEYPGMPFKVTFTGPTTFAFSVASTGAGPAYRGAMDPALHEDLAAAIRPLVREAARRGAFIQIDDPFLSQGMRDFTTTLQRLDAIASEAPRDRMHLHVCGGLARGKVMDALLRLERISTLFLAFAGRLERENLDLLDGRAWSDRDMFLGAGCIPVQVAKTEEVSTPKAVADLIGRVSQRIGPDRLRYVLPDCGFRATAKEFVPPILESLRKGFEAAFPSPS